MRGLACSFRSTLSAARLIELTRLVPLTGLHDLGDLRRLTGLNHLVTRTRLGTCVVVSMVGLAACIPDGPPSPKDKSVATAFAPATGLPNPRSNPAQRATAPSGTGAGVSNNGTPLPNDPPLSTESYEDTFDRTALGPEWRAMSPGWKIVDGQLCGEKARNKGVWLARKLPVNARIEFDAVSRAQDGDIKVEAWGDGVSGATGASYNNATSYLAILGGWKNSLHVLARLDEHGSDRRFLTVDTHADDERLRPVTTGQIYHFKIERSDGKTIGWDVNDVGMLEITDSVPLAGSGHDHLGFNDWDSPVCFDNLKITPM